MKLCPKCNMQLEDSAAFCPNCGTQFIPNATVTQQPYVPVDSADHFVRVPIGIRDRLMQVHESPAFGEARDPSVQRFSHRSQHGSIAAQLS